MQNEDVGEIGGATYASGADTTESNGSTPVLARSATPDDYRGITPEILAVIETAASTFLGKKIRVLSVKLADGSAMHSSSWATQGRDIIHSSHNLVQRGH